MQDPKEEWRAHHEYLHLHESVARLIELSADERATIAADSRGFWVPSAQTIDAKKEIDWLRKLPRGPRMPNLLIAADPGSGKSTLLRSYQKSMPKIALPDSAILVPAHQIFDVTLIKSDEELLGLIAATIHCPLSTKGSMAERVKDLARYANRIESVLWSLDEIQSFLELPPRAYGMLVQAVKALANNIHFPIVAAGSRDAASVFRDEMHMKQRFRQFTILPWRTDTKAALEEFAGWFFGFVSRIPLREPSPVFAESYLKDVVGRSFGNTERVALATRRAAAEALAAGKEQIAPDRLLALV